MVYKKRRYRKRNRRRRFRSRAKKPVTGIPDRQRVKLKYVTYLNLGGTPFPTYVFRGNNVYDPDLSGGGHQPTGLDQWNQFYSKYKCHASKIKCTLVSNTASGPGSNAVFSINPQLTTSAIGYRTIDAQPYSKSVVLASGYAGRSFMSNYMSTKKVFGLSEALDDDFRQPIGSLGDTTRDWYWSLELSALDLTTALNSALKVEIIYYLELTDRISLPIS